MIFAENPAGELSRDELNTGHSLEGVIRDGSSIELDHVQCPQAAHCQIIAKPRQMQRSISSGRPRVGPFPIETPANYADECDAQSARASSITPAPRLAILICRSPLATPSSQFLLHRLILASAWRPQRRAFLHPSVRPGFSLGGGDFRTGRRHGFLADSNGPRYIRKPLNLLDDWCARVRTPTLPLRMMAFRANAADPAGPPRSPFSHAGR